MRDQGDFEDEAWNDPGVIGIIVAIIIIAVVLGVGGWLDNNAPGIAGAAVLLAGSH